MNQESVPHDSALESMLSQAPTSVERMPALRVIHLVLPPLLVLAAITALAFAGLLGRVSAAAAASFFTLGKLIVILGAVPESSFRMSAWELAAMVVFMDTVYAYFLAYNLDVVFRFRRLGPALLRLTNFCRYVLSTRPWMRRWAVTGVVLFVMFPVTGTGAPGGAILGRIVGLKPHVTLGSIVMGSVLGCGVLALFSEPLRPVFQHVQHELWFKLAGVALIGIVVLFLYRVGRRLSRESEAFATTPGEK